MWVRKRENEGGGIQGILEGKIENRQKSHIGLKGPPNRAPRGAGGEKYWLGQLELGVKKRLANAVDHL